MVIMKAMIMVVAINFMHDDGNGVNDVCYNDPNYANNDSNYDNDRN